MVPPDPPPPAAPAAGTPPAAPTAGTPPAAAATTTPSPGPLAGQDPSQLPAPTVATPPAAPAAGTPPAAPAAGTPPATPAAGTPPASTDPITFQTSAQLDERLARHSKSQLRELFGTDNTEEIKVQIKAGKDAAAAAETARQAELTATQRLTEERDAATTRADEAEEARDAAIFESHINGVCAEKGITNVGYATWAIRQAVEKLEEGQQLDEGAYLDTLLQNDQHKAALGAPVTQAAPVTTTPGTGGTPATGAPTPPPPGQPQPKKTAMEMTPAEFEAHKATLAAGG